MLQTLLRPGQTERVEAALAALDEHERGDPEMRATLASLRLAQHDPQAAYPPIYLRAIVDSVRDAASCRE